MQPNIYTIFSPGSYGTYLSWAVYSYSSLNTNGEIVLPFSSSGSAHKYRNTAGFMCVHPTHDMPANCNRAIIIQPTEFLDYLDNQYSKQNDYETDVILSVIIQNFEQKLIEDWGPDIDIWQKRELCSFFLPAMFKSLQQKIVKYQSQLPNAISINASDILTDLLGSLCKIWAFFGITQTCSDSVILTNHNTYLGLQRHIGKSVYVNSIVDHCLDGNDMSIGDLTIFDEAYIQFLLRERGYEMRCYNLNVFPKTTQDLRELLYDPANQGN